MRSALLLAGSRQTTSQICSHSAALICTAAVLALTSCTDNSVAPEAGPSESPLVHKRWKDKEAELLALSMSDMVGAPRLLYERVRNDLAVIRRDYSEVISSLDTIAYHPAWESGLLEIGVEESTYDQIRSGEYTAWDDLNREYRFDYAHAWRNSNRSRVSLFFQSRLSPIILAAEYERLPGIRWAGPRPMVDEGANIAGYLEGDVRRYFFRSTWGGCRPFCDSTHYWEFRGVGQWVRFAGQWPPSSEIILRLSCLPGLGYCPEPGELLGATVTHGSSRNLLFTGRVAREIDPATGRCIDDPLPPLLCLEAVRVPVHVLTPRENGELTELLAAIPIEPHEIDGACDPCLVTRYEFGERVEEDNPCATASSTHRRAIDDLELFLRELVFGE